jgi:hypothetical protein
MDEAVITFCGALDGLLYERTHLTAMKAITINGGRIYWLQEFLVNRALARNLKRIREHDCALCQRFFRSTRGPLPSIAAQKLVNGELGRLHERAQALLKQEIEEGALLD